MRQNLVTPDFAARLYFPPGRHRPMKERVETCHPHSAGGRLHVFEESGESPDDFSFRQFFRDREKFLDETPASAARAIQATAEFLPA